MKKKIIALAIAGALAAPLAAQAEATVYGKARVSIDSISYDKNSGMEDSMYVSSQTSRVGVKGSEDLGGGMKAIYGMEWGVDLTGDGGDMGERNRYVGLSGDFGTVLAGKHDTPYKMVGSADVFADTLADSQNNGGIIGYNGFDNRANNAVAYVSPSLSGWTILVAGVAGEQDAAGQKANGLTDAISAGVKGSVGPVKVGLGYETFSTDLTGLAEDKTATKLDLGYKMGTLGLGLTVESSNNGTNTKQDLGTLASVTYGMGANTIALQYGSVSLDDANKSTTADDHTLAAIGLVHSFSKATNVYAAYASFDSKIDAQDASGFTFGLNTQF